MIPNLLLLALLLFRGGHDQFEAPTISDIETDYATQISVLTNTIETATFFDVVSKELWESVDFSSNYDDHNLLVAEAFRDKPKRGGRSWILVQKIKYTTRKDVSPTSTNTNGSSASVIMYRDQSTKSWTPAVRYRRIVKKEKGYDCGFEFILHIDTIRNSDRDRDAQ